MGQFVDIVRSAKISFAIAKKGDGLTSQTRTTVPDGSGCIPLGDKCEIRPRHSSSSTSNVVPSEPLLVCDVRPFPDRDRQGGWSKLRFQGPPVKGYPFGKRIGACMHRATICALRIFHSRNSL